MNENNQHEYEDKYLNDLLDHGLTHYAKSEPHPGLETTLLANLSSGITREQKTRLSASWPWQHLGWAAAMFILVVGATFLSMNHPPDKQNPPIAVIPSPKPTVPPTIQTPSQSSNTRNMNAQQSIHVLSTATHKNTLREKEPVRLAIFPSPSPLTEQEKYFLQFVKTSKRDDLIAISHPDAQIPGTENKTDDNKAPNESRLKNTGNGIENAKN